MFGSAYLAWGSIDCTSLHYLYTPTDEHASTTSAGLFESIADIFLTLMENSRTADSAKGGVGTKSRILELWKSMLEQVETNKCLARSKKVTAY
jgi:hypothetical protein